MRACEDNRFRRAVEYVRMSTDHQKYSTENQADAIRAYAATNDMEIVRTYSDEGRSGLQIKGRDAFQNLISDVESGNADFDVILVYDLSRWGRFQNLLESAHYEYLCHRAGIDVHYCAEEFANDGSVGSSMLRGLKSYMAGAYSRDLGVKVFAGQCRLIRLGFRQGGPAGYGLRRALLNERGDRKGELRRGEQKSLQTDRVILVPGPREEIATVRQIYAWFIDEGKTESQIAAALNALGLETDLGRPWTRGTVHQILSNEKYIGNNVYNRKSFKLKERRVANAPQDWVRADDVFSPLIDRQQFAAAQAIIHERSRRCSDAEMLDQLRRLLDSHGYISGLIIDEAEGMPSSGAYQRRFGSLVRAYHLVGFRPDRDYRYIEVNRALRILHRDAVASAIAEIKATGGTIQQDAATDLLTINGEFTASLVVARCQRTSAGSRRWKIRFDTGLAPDITIAIRMDDANQKPRDYYILPRIGMTADRLGLSEENGLMLDAWRFETLDAFYAMTGRVRVSEFAPW